MNPLRTHDREVFYKYMPASTALTVLRNKTLRWSSPVEFNDPFDVPAELAHDIEPSEIKAKIGEILVNLFQDEEIDLSRFSKKVQLVSQLIRSADNKTKNEIEKALIAEVSKTFDKSENLEDIRNMWRELIPNFRILCLSTVNNAASMWHHYAEKYTGVVIEIACSDEMDSPWLLARPVDYPEEPPALFSAKGWAKLLMMPIENAFDDVIGGYTYNKTPDWRYEEEWRITSFKRNEEVGTISDWKLNPLHFKKIYLGPLIDTKDKAEILDVIKSEIPHASVYDVGFGLNRKFVFTEVTNG